MNYAEAGKGFMIHRKANIWQQVVECYGIDLDLGGINEIMEDAMNDPDIRKRVENAFITYILDQLS